MANEDFDDTIELASQVKSYQKTTKDGNVVTVRGYTRVNTDNSAVTERATRKPGRPRIAASTGRFPGDRSTPVFPDAGKTVSNPGEKKVEYKDLPDTGVVDQAALDREVPVALAVPENQPSNPALKKLKSILSSLSTASLTTDVAFDPSPEEVLGQLLPAYFRTVIFHALLDSAAAEHGARRRAMQSATDNANEVLGTLSRTYNRERQGAITTELNEIIGGASALEDY